MAATAASSASDNIAVDKHSSTASSSGDGVWLDAHYDPVASLYTYSSCIGKCSGSLTLVHIIL